jgi:hypothetical protein
MSSINPAGRLDGFRGSYRGTMEGAGDQFWAGDLAPFSVGQIIDFSARGLGTS